MVDATPDYGAQCPRLLVNSSRTSAMSFSPWQLRALRNALVDYQVLMAVNGEKRSVRLVLEDILLSEDTKHMPGRKPAFKEEALRRFINGLETLKPDKLEDVKRFLVAEKVITLDELASESHYLVEALRVHGVLASSTDRAKTHLGRLMRAYRASRSGRFRTEHFELHFVREPMDTLVGVEERVWVEARDKTHARAAKAAKDGYGLANSFRRGFGLVSSDQPTMHFFVRGDDPEDLIHYVEVGTHALLGRGSSILLMRSGDLPPEPGNLEVSIENTLQQYNFLFFTAVDEQKVRLPRAKRAGSGQEERPQ